MAKSTTPAAARSRAKPTTRARAGDLTPLDFLLKTLRDAKAAPEDRKWAAQQALPYMHPRLSTVAHSGDVLLRHEDALEDLE
ncbi:MAG: hypothetical protein RIC36_14895 [Rhodospirillales bacterium]